MTSAAPTHPPAHPATVAAGAPPAVADGAAAGAAEQLSAWLDGELDAASGERMVAGLLQTGADRQRYAAWCLVGDALRSHEVAAGHSPRLCSRIADALQDEPALLAPRALAARRAPAPLARHVASGAAIAAAAAVVVMVALPQLRISLGASPGRPAELQAAAGPVQPAPVALAAGAAANPRNPRLDPYFQAHRDFSGGGVMPAAAVYLRFGSEGDR